MVNIWDRFLTLLGRRPPRLPDHGYSYLEHLLAEYQALGKDVAAIDAVKTRLTQDRRSITWADVFLVERLLLDIESDPAVIRMAWLLRSRFEVLADDKLVEAYRNSTFPCDTNSPEKMALFRADLARLLEIVHWHLSLVPLQEFARTKLTSACVFLILFYTGLYFATLAWCSWHNAQFLAMLLGVIYFGVLGGFVSALRRLASVPDDEPLLTLNRLSSAGYFLWLSPVLGGVFAVILALMLAAGVLSGAIFPKFAVESWEPHGVPFFHFTWNTLPTSSTSYALLYIWSFIAGFAERFVPDSLDRLISRASEDKKTPAPSAPPVPTPRPGQANDHAEPGAPEPHTPAEAEPPPPAGVEPEKPAPGASPAAPAEHT